MTSGQARSLAALLATTALLGACSNSTSPPSSSTTTPSPTTNAPASPPPEAGDFFTWEQRRAWDGPTADVARTIQTEEYFTGLAGRYEGFADPRWPQIVTPGLRDFVQGPIRAPRDSQGSVTHRLMEVRVDGETATTVVCEDFRQVQSAPHGTEDWENSTPSIAVSVDTLTRAPKSPTGWQIDTTRADSDLTREKCRRAFNNAEPAVTEVGEPDYIDTWPQPEQSPDAS